MAAPSPQVVLCPIDDRASDVDLVLADGQLIDQSLPHVLPPGLLALDHASLPVALSSHALHSDVVPVAQPAERSLDSSVQVNDHTFGGAKRHDPHLIELRLDVVGRLAVHPDR